MRSGRKQARQSELVSFLTRLAKQCGDQMPSGFDGISPAARAARRRSSLADRGSNNNSNTGSHHHPSRDVDLQDRPSLLEDELSDGDEEEDGQLAALDPIAADSSDDDAGDEKAAAVAAVADSGCVFRLPVKTKRQVFDWYVKDLTNRSGGSPYSYPNFTSLWRQLCPHIKVQRKGRSGFSECNSCIEYKNLLYSTGLSNASRRIVAGRFGQHLLKQMAQRERYDTHKAKARPDASGKRGVLSIAIDAMAQHNGGTVPHYGSDNPKKESTKQKMEFKPMVILLHHVCLLVLCAGGWLLHGQSLVAECIHASLLAYPGSLPRKLHLQLDNANDNKSHVVIGYCAILVYFGYFETVSIHFLIVGHTHIDLDQKNSVFSWALRKGGKAALSWISYVFVIMTSFKKPENRPQAVDLMDCVHDWAAWLEPCLNPISRFACSNESGDAIRCFKLKRGPRWGESDAPACDRVRMFYKRYMTDYITLPRPYQKGTVFRGPDHPALHGGEVLTQGTYDRATRAWTFEVNNGACSGFVTMASPGIPILTSTPATPAPSIAPTPDSWPEELKNLKANLESQYEGQWFRDGRNSSDKAWWVGFLAHMSSRGQSSPDGPDGDLVWPVKYCADDAQSLDVPVGAPPSPGGDGADPLQFAAAGSVQAYGATQRRSAFDAIDTDDARLVDAVDGQFVIFSYAVGGGTDLYALGHVTDVTAEKLFTVHWWCRTGRNVTSDMPFLVDEKFRRATRADAAGAQHIFDNIEQHNLVYALCYHSGGSTHPLLSLNRGPNHTIPRKKVAGGGDLHDDVKRHLERWERKRDSAASLSAAEDPMDTQGHAPGGCGGGGDDGRMVSLSDDEEDDAPPAARSQSARLRQRGR